MNGLTYSDFLNATWEDTFRWKEIMERQKANEKAEIDKANSEMKKGRKR